jgi:Domain of unknown function (DUF6265)
MKWQGLLLMAVSALLSFHAPAQVQSTPNTLKLEAEAKSPPATLKEVAWLAGRWTGEGLGGQVEEVWTPASQGQMMGMFRLVKEAKIVFYEFITIAEHDGSLEMRIRHFNSNMTAWEEKEKFLTFKLVKIDGDKIHFSGFTMERKGDNAWEGYLAMRGKDGALREERFVLKRAPI